MENKLKKYKFGILLAATKDSSFTLGTMIANIKDKMGDFVDIFYIIHDGFSLEDMEAMKKLSKNSEIVFSEFTQETFMENFRKFGGNALKFNFSSGFLGRWTHMVYACFEVFRFLEECESILYLDFDILILKGMEHLAKLKERGISIAAERGKKRLNEVYPHYNGEFANNPIYRSGSVLVNDTILDPKECYAFVYQKSADVAYGLNDQGILSLLIYEKNLKTQNLGKEYVGSVHWLSNDEVYFVHAYGRDNRFWNNRLCHQVWREWEEYYNVWLKAGGSPYKGGFVANTTYGYERVRFHLTYKIGYAVIEIQRNLKSKWEYLKLPLIMIKITLKHKRKLREYHKKIQEFPHLKLPPLSAYDYNQILQEKQSIPYRLGEAILEFYREWWKFDIFRLYRKINAIKKEAQLRFKNQNASKPSKIHLSK